MKKTSIIFALIVLTYTHFTSTQNEFITFLYTLHKESATIQELKNNKESLERLALYFQEEIDHLPALLPQEHISLFNNSDIKSIAEAIIELALK